MKLNLTKPIVVFDLETTGLSIGKDKIIEISMIKVYPDGTEEEMTMRLNPGVHIPMEITALTGISDADVADKPRFEQVAYDIKDFIANADLAGYNSNKFDIPMLVEEFLRAGIEFSVVGRNLVDVQNIFHKMESRTLSAAYKFYCHKDLDAHHADNDTRATLEVLKSQLDMYEGREVKDRYGNTTTPIVNDMQQLAIFSKASNWVDLVGHIYLNDNCVECFNFGKYKGQSVEEVFRKEPSYYSWMMNADFPLSTKQVIQRIRTLM